MSTANKRGGERESSNDIIRSAKDLVLRIERNPASAAQITGMDRWERWLLEHGMPLVAAGLDDWEAAALEYIVRHTPAHGRMPQQWLFEGGHDGGNLALMLPFLGEEARKKRLSRLIRKLHKLGPKLGLTFKVERAADCSKTIYTNTTAAYACVMPPPQNGR
jgi:hypothetical protein